MKQLSIGLIFKSVATFFMLSFIRVFCWAQNDGSSKVTTTHTTSTVWYAQPWVWIIGGAVFILLLVALLRGGSGRSDRITVTKTTDV